MCLWLLGATSGPCSVEKCLKSSETGLSISHQDHSSNFHPGPSANFFTPCCSSLCVPLHAPCLHTFPIASFSPWNMHCLPYLMGSTQPLWSPPQGPTAADGRGRRSHGQRLEQRGPLWCAGPGALAVADEGAEASWEGRVWASPWAQGRSSRLRFSNFSLDSAAEPFPCTQWTWSTQVQAWREWGWSWALEARISSEEHPGYRLRNSYLEDQCFSRRLGHRLPWEGWDWDDCSGGFQGTKPPLLFLTGKN